MITGTAMFAAELAQQDTVTPSAQTPPAARAIIDKMMSPFCPGLTLQACPSPSADSLRNVIIARVRAGDKESDIVNQLYADWGTAIRGAPEFKGSGVVAWIMPGLAVIVALFVLTRWLRRKTRGENTSAPQPTSAFRSDSADGYSTDERVRLEQLLKRGS